MCETEPTSSTSTNSQLVPSCCDCLPGLYLCTHSQPTHSQRPTGHCRFHPSSNPATYFQEDFNRRGGHTACGCRQLPRQVASIAATRSLPATKSLSFPLARRGSWHLAWRGSKRGNSGHVCLLPGFCEAAIRQFDDVADLLYGCP